MSEPRDYKAEFGSQPNWSLQRRKQEQIAEERDRRLHGEIEVPEPDDL